VRWKLFWEKIRGRADLRSILKMGAWSFFWVLAAGLAIKLFLFDSVKVSGTQMEPAVASGDRILIFKTPYMTPGLRTIFARPEKPVVAEIPDKSTNTILRIAATSGDTVSIDAGQFYRNGQPLEQFYKDTDKYGIIPAEYSPVDYMAEFRLPEPGDSITFSQLTMRDLIFTYSMLRQEKPRTRMKPFVIENGNVSDNYEITDFAFYNGPINQIPKHLRTDWFFWDRLQEYFEMTSTTEGKSAQLAFAFFRGAREVKGFRVTKHYAFLMGENWSGAKDSRYFGPILINNIEGRALVTLWGFKTDDNEKQRLDWDRFFKFIK